MFSVSVEALILALYETRKGTLVLSVSTLMRPGGQTEESVAWIRRALCTKCRLGLQ